jgi:hypothetical protein
MISPFNSENERIELYWQDIYQTTNAANVVIDRVPLIDMDVMKRDHLVSEARFIRAMMYFEAVRFFGDVPLILHESVDLDDAFAARSPKAEVMKQSLLILNGRVIISVVRIALAGKSNTNGVYCTCCQKFTWKWESMNYQPNKLKL